MDDKTDEKVEIEKIPVERKIRPSGAARRKIAENPTPLRKRFNTSY